MEEITIGKLTNPTDVEFKEVKGLEEVPLVKWCKQVVEVSRNLGQIGQVEFEGVQLLVHPEDTWFTVFERYQNTYGLLQAQTIINRLNNTMQQIMFAQGALINHLKQQEAKSGLIVP